MKTLISQKMYTYQSPAGCVWKKLRSPDLVQIRWPVLQHSHCSPPLLGGEGEAGGGVLPATTVQRRTDHHHTQVHHRKKTWSQDVKARKLRQRKRENLKNQSFKKLLTYKQLLVERRVYLQICLSKVQITLHLEKYVHALTVIPRPALRQIWTFTRFHLQKVK